MTNAAEIEVEADGRGHGWSRGQKIAALTSLAVLVWIAGIVVASKWLADDGAGTSMAGMPGMQMGPSQGTASSEVNQADVTFARAMASQLQGLLDASAIAETRARSPEVRRFAASLRSSTELETIRGWLRSWGVSASGPSEHDSGVGTIAAAAVDRLRDSPTAQVDALYLELVRRHLRGTAMMAEVELDGGGHPPVTELARRLLQSERQTTVRLDELAGRLDAQRR